VQFVLIKVPLEDDDSLYILSTISDFRLFTVGRLLSVAVRESDVILRSTVSF